MSSQSHCIAQKNEQLHPRFQKQPIMNNPNNVSNHQHLQGEKRFELQHDIADTLQGRIYGGIDKINGNYVIVKEAWKQLVKLKMSRNNHEVSEDFINEKEVITFLSNQKDCNFGFVRIIDEWEDKRCYYYAMEACQGGLFEYIKNMHVQHFTPQHASQQANNLSQDYLKKSTEWIKTVRHIFCQLVDCVSWMHSKGICHLDLSLENTMIYDKLSQTVKIIDFGLALKAQNGNFISNKRVGKISYMAPEVYAKQQYDSRKADIWSLGVMLFMMLTGVFPYELPTTSNNPTFEYIINGYIGNILKHWNLLHRVTAEALDLINKIFRMEKDRISMKDLREHSFLNSTPLHGLIQDNDDMNLHVANEDDVKNNNRHEQTTNNNIHQNINNNHNNNHNNNNHNNNHNHNNNNNNKMNNEINSDVCIVNEHNKHKDRNQVRFNGEYELNLQKYQFKSAEAIGFQRRMLLDGGNINIWSELANAIAEIQTKKEFQQLNNDGVVCHQEGVKIDFAVIIDELKILQKFIESKYKNVVLQ